MCLACIEFSKTPDYYELKAQLVNLVNQNEVTIDHAVEVMKRINEKLEEKTK